MTAIEVDEFLPHPPARVWRALTNQKALATWFMPGDLQPVVGHRFTFQTQPQPAYGFDGVVQCEILAVQPERLLRFAWRTSFLDTTVTWTLAAEGNGTRLFVEHAGFDPDDPVQQEVCGILGSGWRSGVLASLRDWLARDAPAA